MAEIDRLEINIEEKSSGTNKELDKLVSALSTLSSLLKGIDTSGFSNIEKGAKKTADATKQMSKTANDVKKVDAQVRVLAHRFKDLGKNIDVSKYANPDGIKKLTENLQKSKDKLEQLKASGRTKGIQFENSVAGVKRLENELDRATAKFKGMKNLSSRNFNKNFTITRPETSTSAVADKPKILNSTPRMMASDWYANKDKRSDSKSSNSNNEFSEAGSATSGLKATLSSISSIAKKAFSFPVNTRAIKELQKETDKARLKLNSLYERRDKAESLGTNKGRAFSGLQYDIKNSEESLSRLESRMAEFQSRSRSIPSGLISIGKAGVAGFSNIKSIVGKVTPLIKTFGSKIAGAVKSMSVFRSQSGKTSLSANGLAKAFFKVGNMAKLMVLRMGIRGAISGVQAGFENLAQYSDTTNRAISSVISNLNYLKNSLAAAFSPVLSVIAPIIDKLVDVCVIGINAVNQFFAALTGSTSYTKAKKVSVDYAAGLTDVADSANEAADATKAYQRTLLGFDEINKMDDHSSDSSGSGGSSGVGDIASGVSDMFDTVPIDSKIKGFAEKIKAMIGAEDWDGLGTYLGECVNSGLQKIDNLIRWDNVGAKITKGCNAITETFNSFVDHGLNWNLLGQTIGDGVNTCVNTFNLLFGENGFDFENLGLKMSQGLMSAVDTIDWVSFGNSIGNAFMISWNLFAGFVSGLNPELLSKSFAGLINGAIERIDLGKIGTALGVLATKIGTFLSDSAKNIHWDELADNIATGINNFFDGFEGDKFSTGITDMVNSIKDCILRVIKKIEWGDVVTDIGTAIANLPWGTILPVLLVASIPKIASSLLGVFKEAVKGSIFQGGLTGLFSEGGVLAGLIEGISSIALPAAGVIAAIVAIAVVIKDLWDTSEAFRDVCKDVASAIVDKLKYAFDKCKAAAEPLVEDFKKLFSSLYDLYEKSGLKGLVEKFASLAVITGGGIISTAIDLISSAFSALARVLGGAIEIITGVVEVLNGLATFDGEKIKQGFADIGRFIMNGLIGGLVEIATGLWDIVCGIFQTLVDNVKAFFGIHSPSTVFAEIGGFLMEGLLGGITDTVESVFTWFSELPGKIKDKIGDAKTYLVEKGKGLIEGLKNGYEESRESGLLSYIGKLRDQASEKIGDIKSKGTSKGKELIDGLKNGYENIRQSGFLSYVSKIKEQAFTSIGDIKGKLKEKGLDLVKGMVEGYGKGDSLLGVVNKLPNSIKDALSGLGDIGRNAISAFKSAFTSVHIPMPHLNWSTGSLRVGKTSISYPKFNGIEWYANSGFPGGEVWGMNESGNPEMVGKLGGGSGKTAVANNAIIADAIEGAVVRGMMQVAMATSGGQTEEKSDGAVILQVGNEQLAKAVVTGINSLKRRGIVLELA